MSRARLRGITLSYTVDTSQGTESKTLTLGDEEDVGELVERFTVALHEGLGEEILGD